MQSCTSVSGAEEQNKRRRKFWFEVVSLLTFFLCLIIFSFSPITLLILPKYWFSFVPRSYSQKHNPPFILPKLVILLPLIFNHVRSSQDFHQESPYIRAHQCESLIGLSGRRIQENICCKKVKKTTKGNNVSKNSEDILEDRKSTKLEILPIENPLTDSDLQPRLIARHGIPASCCIIAYDPLHHALALATLNGQIKVFPAIGSEILLQSSSSIRLLQIFYNGSLIISVNGENILEIWDINTAELLCARKWGQCVTALAVIQDTVFLYVGDDAGTITTAQYDHSAKELNVLPYVLTLHQMLGDFCEIYDEKSVIEVLLHPIAVYEMVLICYANGMCILWRLHDREVLAVCTHRQCQIDDIKAKRGQVKTGNRSSERNVNGADVGSLMSVCWCCTKGRMFATGYKNGDIWLWNIPKNHKKGDDEKNHINYSNIPICKFKGGSMIHISKLRWWKDDGNKREKNGFICALGGKTISACDTLKVISLTGASSISSVELYVPGDIEDVYVIDSLSAIFAAVKSHRTLYSYDLKEVHRTLKMELPATVKGVPIVFPVLESRVTAARILLLHQTGNVVTNLLQIPRILSSYPYYQTSDEEQFIDSQCEGCYLYITGHENGSVHFWHVSSQISLIRIQERKGHKGPSTMGKTEVSSLDFCQTTGFLAVGYKSGLVALYRLDAENKESFRGGYWSLVSSFKKHEESVSCIVISHLCQCVAAGSDCGIVSLINLEKHVLLYHGRAHPSMTSAIISLNFLPLSAFVTLPSCGYGSTTGLKQKSDVKSQNILVLATKNQQIFILDAKSGLCCMISLKVKEQGKCISLHILDASGDSLQMASGYRSRLLPETTSIRDPHDRLIDLQNLLCIFCTEDAVHVYQLSSLLKGICSSLTIRLQSPCYWASTFQTPTNRIGLVLVYRSNLIEVRDFPNFNVLRSITLENVLGFKIEPDLSLIRIMSCTVNGQIILVHQDVGLIVLSLLDSKHDNRFSTSPPAAFPGESELKKMKPFEKILKATNFLKVRDRSSQKLLELEQLLTTNNSVSHQLSFSSNEYSHSYGDELNVDDIEIEDENDETRSTRSGLIRKFKKKIKERKRLQREGKQTTENEADSGHIVHGARSVDEIKAIYGQDRDQAAGLRDKLIEQREKLQAVEKRTADLQEGAENFHHLAEELNKAIQGKNKKHI